MAVGSISYAAPEQLMGEQIDGRADQYALAATAFHLLAGTPPYEHSNVAVIIGKHLTAPPPLLAERRPHYARLDPVLSKAMAKDPAQRYPGCLDFARALGAAMTAHPQPPVMQPTVPWQAPGPPIPLATTPWPLIPARPRRRWPAIVVPLLLVVLLMGAASFAATQVMRPRPQPSTAAPQWQPYVDYAKQFTVWLTSLSSESAAGDIQRIIDGSTGEFHDDFAKRSSDFSQVVIQSKTTTKGTVNSAALDSINGSTAEVLVAATSKITNLSGANDEPRSWRMRVRVEKIGDTYKVSKVEFVA